MKRRDFLRAASWTLAALGVSDTWGLGLGGSEAVALSAHRYYQALAQTTSRKLALLVGINQYSHIKALSGCLTDVELQRELLIHRFGFKEGDILTLSDQQATRQQIETAFLNHITEQAKPGDVVVFHFSGYGRRVQLSETGLRSDEVSSSPLAPPQTSPLILNSLVPSDGVGQTLAIEVVNDLLEDTLWLLLRSLATDQVTTILDTSFNAPDALFLGNLRIRSHPQVTQGQISAEELEFQQRLLSRQGNRWGQAVIASRQPMPGVVLTAAGSTKMATEGQWAGFSAGLFTYALTQYLWEATPATTVQASLNRVTGIVEQLVGKEQQPTLSGQKSQEKSLLTYHLMPEIGIGADGVVIGVEDDGKTAQLWLAGLPPAVLEYYGVNSQLSIVNPIITDEVLKAPNTSSLLATHSSPLQVRSRKGLTAKAQLSSNEVTGSLQVGQLVQEVIRVLPQNIKLNIALDAGLERIERVDATSAFAGIPYVSLVTAGEQPADYIFSRVLEVKTQELPTTGSSNMASRYGLFSLGQELIPDTAGETGEAVKVAVQRLVPKLQTLVAAKLWRLTGNEGSSRLDVKATLKVMTATERVLMERETLRSQPTGWTMTSEAEKPSQNSSTPGIPTLPIGSRIQYQVHNNSDRPVYVLLFGLDSSRSAIALYPTEPDRETNSSETKPLLKDVVIAPRETLTLPQNTVDFEWVIQGPASLSETQLIFSTAKFTQTTAALAAAMHPRREQKHIGTLLNPLEVAQAILQDLHNASAVAAETTSLPVDSYGLDVNAWATLSFIYQVV